MLHSSPPSHLCALVQHSLGRLQLMLQLSRPLLALLRVLHCCCQAALQLGLRRYRLRCAALACHLGLGERCLHVSLIRPQLAHQLGLLCQLALHSCQLIRSGLVGSARLGGLLSGLLVRA